MAPAQPLRWKRFKRWIAWIAWAGLALEAVLWFAFAGAPIDNLLLLVVMGIILFLGTWSCTVALIIHYRQIFGAWYGLAALVVALGLVSWGRGVVPPSGVTGLLLMGTLALAIALPTSIVLLLLRCDVSVVLVGLVLLAFVWGSLLASVPHGGPIRVWLQYLTGANTGQFWWFETLTCLLMLILPLGSVAFTVHLVRLLAKEVQGS